MSLICGSGFLQGWKMSTFGGSGKEKAGCGLVDMLSERGKEEVKDIALVDEI